MAKKKYFGTDGIRGKVGDHPMTAEFVLRLGWAVGKVLASQGNNAVLVGKDTRISGYLFESALEAGLSSAGVDCQLLGPMPTPAIAYLTRTFRAAAGIVISASHNPYYDNGLKFFGTDGKKLPDETEFAIEAMLDQAISTVDSAHLGKVARLGDASGRYIEYCKSTFPSGGRLNNMRLVVDSANGATYDIAKRVFRELGAEVIIIGCEPDGLNINKDCGATAPDNLRAHVLLQRADVGIALDGDGDRLIMVDNRGEIVDGDELLYILAKAQSEAGPVEGVVGTLMSNLGLEHALNEMNIPFQRAAVGDRYVMELLEKNHWTLGGESSGHIVLLNQTTTGDGIIAALQALAYMSMTGKSLYELKSGMTRYPQVLINVPLPFKVDLDSYDEIKQAVKAAEEELGESGRVLLRPSGTEPVVRVMVEGRVASDVERICNRIATAVNDAVSA
ncbi:MAG: phosphoglucosamine mutase [Gammaproteobacteria bacterium]|nr:phosphoglucosamine mutase [Gammaproteobacteria bacterium]